jgi:hypothetical protein
MLDRLRWPLDLRIQTVSSAVADVPGASGLLKPERRQCASCGAHAYALQGKGRCGNCGGAALQPLRS